MNLNGIRCKEPMLAIIYDGGYVHMLLSVWVTDQAADTSYGFSLDLRLVMLVPVNYWFFFYKKIILKLFSVGCRHYEISGVIGC